MTQAACSSEIECVSVRDVLARVASGQLRATGFRRGFVWNGADSAALLDSVRRGLPIGIVVLWRTSVRLPHETELGPAGCAGRPVAAEHDYVLDGRQRIEVLCRAFAAGAWLGEGALERAVIPLQIVRTNSSEQIALAVERLIGAGVAAETYDIIRAWQWHALADLETA